MYNRYMPPRESFHLVEFQDSQNIKPTKSYRTQDHKMYQKPPDSDLLGELTGGIRDFLGRIFEGFSLQNLDSGDILLLLIILFLYLEGDNLDLIIALGVMLLLGLGGSESQVTNQSGE